MSSRLQASIQTVWLIQPETQKEEMFTQILHHHGVESVSSLNSPEQLLHSNKTLYADVLLFDVHHLDVRWEAVLQKFVQTCPECKIVFTAQRPDPRREHLAKQFTPFGFIKWPLNKYNIEQDLQRLFPFEGDQGGEPNATSEPDVAGFTGVPIRTKITIPYVLLSVFVAIALVIVIGQLVVENLENRFNTQLIEAGQLSSDLMVREETRRLETLRLLVNIDGVQESLINADTNKLREIALPVAVNTQEEAIDILNREGVSIISLYHHEGGAVEDYIAVRGSIEFREWPFVDSILNPPSESNGRDKYAGIIDTDRGLFFYVSGPVYDADGDLIGVVLIGKSLKTLAREIRQDTFAQVTFYNHSGEIIASTLPSTEALPLSEDDTDRIQIQSIQESFLRDLIVGSLDYTELLSRWQVRDDSIIGLMGVSLPRSLFLQTSQRVKIQIVLIASIVLSAIVSAGILVSNRITYPLLDIVKASTAVAASGNLDVMLKPKGNDEVAVLAKSFNHMLDSLREGEIYRDLLGRTVTPEVRDVLRQSLDSGELQLEGQLQTATLLISDIRRFTTIAEEFGPTMVFRLLNEYFGQITPVITDESGLIMEFVGDAIIAIFGVLPRPINPQESAYQACLAATNMLTIIEKINQQRVVDDLPLFVTGIGINTGDVSTGSIGSANRLHYTAIGDTVNTTQRLENFTKELGETAAVLSHYTYEALGSYRDQFEIELIGARIFKGKTHPIDIYRLRGRR